MSAAPKGRDDAGFTLVEMMIAMLVLAVVVPIATVVIRNLLEQGQATTALVSSMQQDSNAGELLVDYLHSATSITPGSDGGHLSARVAAGYDPLNGISSATLSADCSTVAQPSGVEQLTIGLSEATGSKLTQSYALAVPQNASQPCELFSYGSTGGARGLTWQATSSPSTVAVAVDATFLPPLGNQATSPLARLSTLQTTVFLQSAAVTTTTVAP